jgi:hypothetical protein
MNTKKNLGYGIAVILALAVVALSMAGCPTGEDDTPPAAHVHQWEWTPTTLATCIATGVESGVCKLDPSHTTTRDIPIDLVDGHDWGAWNAQTPATCIAKGSGTRTCRLSNTHIDSGTDNIPIDLVDGHDWKNNWTQTSPSTCEEAAIETDTCNRAAAHTRDRAGAAALGHDWQTTWTHVSNPTETVNGEEARICNHDNTHKISRPLWAIGTAGLEFELISDGNNDGTYRITQSTVNGPVHIPAYWRGSSTNYDDYKLVTEINYIEGTSLSTGAFSNNTTITAVTIAEESELTIIGDNTFRYCSNLTSITIPASVTTIGQSAFAYCTKLASITIIGGVTGSGAGGSIGAGAFISCTSLTGITIPAGITSIATNAFVNCNNLESITVDPANTTYASEGGILYNKAKTELLNVPPKISGAVVIPAGVTTIGQAAFDGCTGLTGITIPDSVTSIGNYAIQSCNGLTSVTLPTSITIIEVGVFFGTGLTSIDIPTGVTSIGMRAFQNCNSLTSVTIPASVTEIGGIAFMACYSLTSVTCLATTPPNMQGSVFVTLGGSPRDDVQIKVPAASVTAYKAATGWSEHADKIVAIQ